MYKSRTLCFGETLYRLTPPGNSMIEQADKLELFVDGAETMASMSLAFQGEDVAFMTALANNRLGKRAVMTLASAGIDTSRITMADGRMGLFYFERGAGERTSSVIYDRSGTPLSLAKRSDFDWDTLLNGIDSFYFSGVLPAIGEELRGAVEDALLACKGRGIKTFCDLNYRPRMWNRAVARETWERLLPFIDVCIGSDEDIWNLFPRPGVNPDRTTTGGYIDYYRDVAFNISEMFGCSTVAIEIRSLAPSGIGRWRALVVKDGEAALSPSREIVSKEHSGCGDTFAASIVHGIHENWQISTIANYALTASALKSTIPGSISYLSSDDIVAAAGAAQPIVDY